MAPPVILIAPGTQPEGAEFLDYSISLSLAYPRAVLAAGGVPWIMPVCTTQQVIAEYVSRSDGVLLTGGDDVHLDLYRSALAFSGSARLRRPQGKGGGRGKARKSALERTVGPPDPTRDLTELALIRQVFQQRKPLLAICRGQQILNVAFGGSLFLDIGREVPGCLDHCQMDRKDQVVHSVEIVADSLLARIVGKTALRVNSTHHQAVREVAPPLRATARSADGVIEAVELGLADRHLLPYLLAVQFHPERLTQRSGEYVEIFRSFTRACASRRKVSI